MAIPALSGSQFRVNLATTTNNQSGPAIQALSGNRFIVAYTDGGSTLGDIRARIYTADGTPIGGEILVTYDQANPLVGQAGVQSQVSIAEMSDGRIALAWNDNDLTGNEEIWLTTLSSTGVQSGAFTAVSAVSTSPLTRLAGNQRSPHVEAFGSGVRVVFDDLSGGSNNNGGSTSNGSATDVRATVLSSSLTTINNSNGIRSDRLNEGGGGGGTFSGQGRPSTTAVLADGSMLVAWGDQSYGTTDEITYELLAPSQFPGGTGLNDNRLSRSGYQYEPNAAGLAGGGWVIVYRDAPDAAPTQGDIRAFISGTSGLQDVSISAAAGVQREPVVAALADGSFVVAWRTDQTITARMFNQAGTAVSDEFVVTTAASVATGIDQNNPSMSIEALGDGRFVIAWTDSSGSLGDTNGSAVHAQIYDPRPLMALPDLTPQADSISFFGVPFSGQPATLSYNIYNNGAVAAGASVAGIYLSLDNVITTSDILVATDNIPAIGAGNFRIEELQFTMPTNLAGTYFVGVIYDHTGTIVESNDANNVTTTVQVTLAAPLFTEGNDIATLPDMGTFENAFTYFYGYGGNDVVTGSIYADVLFGGLGNDTFVGRGAVVGYDQFIGGDGNDTASFAGTTAVVTASLTSGGALVNNVQVAAYQSVENLTGGEAGDTLVGNGNANRLDGGAGADVIFGEAGNDVLVGGLVPAGQTNQLWGGDGDDTADYSAETTRVYADLRGLAGYVTIGATLVVTDTMNSIENITGGSVGDLLVGNAVANVISGGGGTDEINGFEGDDTLLGGTAAAGSYNLLFGGADNDVASYAGAARGVYAELGIFAGYEISGGTPVLVDVYNSVEGLTGSSFADSLVGDAGANRIMGGGGADILYGNRGPTADSSVDTFVYTSATESNLTTGYDTIQSFVTGQDRIDLSAFAINASNVLIASSGGSSSVYANVDGLAGFDLALVVIGTNAVAIGDIRF